MDLCEEHRERFAANPLRVLDCKRPACIDATRDAPFQVDHLCEACAAHFARVLAGLEAVDVEPTVDRRLVRGLDYYTRTTFEFAAEALESAQNAIGGGGRYGALVESLGGPPTPGIGFGCGVERVLLAAAAEGVAIGDGGGISVFVVDTTGGGDALRLTHELRAAGISADRAWDQRSFKAQFKAADRSGAKLALVVGTDESDRGVVAIKDLRHGGAQGEVSRSQVVDHVMELLG